jgi:hypothetical protein
MNWLVNLYYLATNICPVRPGEGDHESVPYRILVYL